MKCSPFTQGLLYLRRLSEGEIACPSTVLALICIVEIWIFPSLFFFTIWSLEGTFPFLFYPFFPRSSVFLGLPLKSHGRKPLPSSWYSHWQGVFSVFLYLAWTSSFCGDFSSSLGPLFLFSLFHVFCPNSPLSTKVCSGSSKDSSAGIWCLFFYFQMICACSSLCLSVILRMYVLYWSGVVALCSYLEDA